MDESDDDSAPPVAVALPAVSSLDVQVEKSVQVQDRLENDAQQKAFSTKPVPVTIITG